MISKVSTYQSQHTHTHTHTQVPGRVVSELRERQLVHPVVLLQGTVTPKVVFQILILSFGLSVGLRVKWRGHPSLHAQEAA